MGSRRRRYRLGPVMLVVWVMCAPAWAQSPEIPAGNPSPEREETYQSLAQLRGREFDRAFLTIMFVHREAAIKMSRAALPRLRDQRVQSWAAALVQAEATERDHISQQLRQIGGPDTKNADLAKVEFGRTFLTTNEPSSADRMFLQQMAVHQASAVAMGRLALTKSHDAHVLTLARDNLTSDTQRMRELRSRLRDHPV